MAPDPTHPAQASPRGFRTRKLQSLQVRIMVWTVLVLVCATFVVGAWLNWIARQTLAQRHQQETERAALVLARQLTGNVTSDAWDGLLPALEDNSAVQFARLVTPRGTTVFEYTANDNALAYYEDALETGETLDRAGRALPLNTTGDLAAVQTPVWYDDGSQAQGGARRLAGYLVIGLHDASMARLLRSLAMAQLGATCVVSLLVIPVVMLFARQWISPLQSLLRATLALANRQQPIPVQSKRRDEIGVLSHAFNVMAGQLYAAQVELEQANEQLEEKVRSRTAELYLTTEKLEREIRDKNEFLRAVSHDLGAPLRNIAGMSKLLMMKYRTALDDEGLRKLERIGANADNQSEMINELLELSRIRTKPGEKTVVDLNEIVQKIAGSLDFDLQDKGIAFQIANPLPTVWAEVNRMRQVFQNLIDNAVKYMGDKPEKRITLHYSGDKHAHTFTLVDTGQGISEEDLPRIFDVFRRATKSGPLNAEGRGVGLANVKSIIETYGGEIKPTSVLGEGTTFTFTFDTRKTTPPTAMMAA